jgi:SH3 domain protein
MEMRGTSIARGVWLLAAVAVAATFPCDTASAEWIRGEVRLNLRVGPGNERKIITTIETGDTVTVLGEVEGWVNVSIADGREGWIPAGFLSDAPPATVRLEKSEKELSTLRERVDALSGDTGTLRSSNESLKKQNDVLTEANLNLAQLNRTLKAASRWPVLITGASILAVGMLMGAIMNSWTSRRAGRLRL